MDSDFWTSRLAAAKRQYNLQHRHQTSHLDRLTIDDFEVDDEVRPDFPCPYCYEDFDIASLCSHLEDDHPCESKVTICPVCYVKVSRDMLSHITLQHGNLFKLQRRCRLRRVAIPNSQALSLLGRDLREAHLQVLLGGGAYRSSGVNVSNANAATDSFLSSLIMNFPASEAEEITKSVVTSFEDTTTKNMAPAHMWKSSLDPSLSYEEREKRIQQATGRAGFVQDLLLTTLLND
ncbi:hypothetical protein ERO13_D09G073100v2 [Gossypium hirsutum]|uniref:Protein DEHYDRATION-INDUCED 19 homolog 4 n=5 Tax=Gossypium TaxID=3633 RepID=A0A1U8I8R0_GOSHI|nr:protein DEHYDRATION-INDUCED 19 homolog 4 [Gossypium raimondii]XP_016672164.1 protein DEHYDRATION-INDUCED 19 homolog 4 [Gossypium hirsutum]TYH53315.1 hypothetical protein ES332_D09G091700v1 [Gossypium tomentosum]TYI64444.1 hypothetical protein E1A91_D09G089300v1 [Gossypium mustelinum]KAG4129327.1 hypothetical protein ERO13_D09G073100v2 [Gossypium hirsutum]KJB34866.1 hypothetical protein B456_006G088100 [Gossypium raimondii]